jgi:hypothetical protein
MPCQRMSSNAPSAVSSRTVWNHGDVTPAANFLAADFVSHNTPRGHGARPRRVRPSRCGTARRFRTRPPPSRSSPPGATGPPSGDRTEAPTRANSWADPPPTGMSHRPGSGSSVCGQERPSRLAGDEQTAATAPTRRAGHRNELTTDKRPPVTHSRC